MGILNDTLEEVIAGAKDELAIDPTNEISYSNLSDEDLDNAVQTCIGNPDMDTTELEKVIDYENVVKENGVSKEIAMGLEELQPGILPEDLPNAMFTVRPSNVNKAETLGLIRNMKIAALEKLNGCKK